LRLPTLVSILTVATCGITLCVVLAVTLLPCHWVTLIPMSMAFTPVTPQEMHTPKTTHKKTLWGITMAISDWMRSQERYETNWLRLTETFSWILVKMTNKMQLCRIIYYSIVPWLLYMFWAILSLIIRSIFIWIVLWCTEPWMSNSLEWDALYL